MKKKPNPFRFYTSSILIKLTGQKADTIHELLEKIKHVSGASIFHHTHHSFRQHHFIPSLHQNDFAYWVSNILQEKELGERLASIDIYEYTDIRSLRKEIIRIIEEYLSKWHEERSVPEGREFHFYEAVSIAMPTDYLVWNLDEFCEALKKVSLQSLYYHFFQSRLRLKVKRSDFAYWIDDSLQRPDIAKKIDNIDFYMYTLEDIREKIIKIIEKA
jgi:hypothetical protein